MPAFSQVEEYAENFVKVGGACNRHENLKYAYHYYNGHTSSLQRRIIRYLNLCLAMKKQIPVEGNLQIAQDLEEIDVNLSNPMSVKSGWERVGSALQCAVDQFKKYAKEATDFSSYMKLHLPLSWWYECNDEERFGSERLCFDLELQFIASLMHNEHWGRYVKLTKRQIEEMEAQKEKNLKEMGDMLSEVFRDELK